MQLLIAFTCFGVFADTFHRILHFDGDFLLYIWRLLLPMAQKSCIRMDTTILFCKYSILQLYGSHTNTIHHCYRNFSTEGWLYHIYIYEHCNNKQICFPQILSAGLAVVASFMWILFFIVGFILPMFMEYFGLSICMTTLGVMCLVNLVFGIYCIPETRGKSFEEITEMMSK